MDTTATTPAQSFPTQNVPLAENILRDDAGNGSRMTLTPRNSDTDREDATINLTDVSCIA